MTVHILTLPEGAVWSKATAGSYRHEARYAAAASGATAYEIRDAAGGLLYRRRLRPAEPRAVATPKPRGKGLTPAAVEAAYCAHGPKAPAVLGCSKQAISGSPDLRAARDRAYAARGEAVPRGTGRPARAQASHVRLYLTPPEVVRLDERAATAGRSRAQQVEADVEAWLASRSVMVPPEPECGTSYALPLTPALLRRIEKRLGVHLRTRAIEVAVRRANQ
jgi:hypothetical protein